MSSGYDEAMKGLWEANEEKVIAEDVKTHKMAKWFKEGDKIPLNAKLIKHEDRVERYQPSEGGYATKTVSYFLYEYEV